MINPVQLLETLRHTFVFRPRNYFWSKRTHNKIDQLTSKIENMREIPKQMAEDFLQQSILLNTSTLLRDYHLKSLKIDSETAPKTYEMLMGDGLDSFLGGKIDV